MREKIHELSELKDSKIILESKAVPQVKIFIGVIVLLVVIMLIFICSYKIDEYVAEGDDVELRNPIYELDVELEKNKIIFCKKQ